jgi:hypothetical protein
LPGARSLLVREGAKDPHARALAVFEAMVEDQRS